MRSIAAARALLVAATVANVALGAHASAPDLATQKKIAAMSVPFVPNAGQWNARAAFAAQTFAGTLFVTKQGELVYSFSGKPVDAGAESVGADAAALGSREATPSRRLPKPSERSPGWALTETLVDSKGHARPMHESTIKAPAGYRPMEGKVSYAIGNDAAKHTNNLNTYERVNLGDMYPGINVQLRATGNNVEKIFTVAPQQDPKQINIAVTGADKLEIGGSGELIAHTGNGPVTFTAPIAFQENAAGERVAVAVSYALNAAGNHYGFALGNYDHAQPLVIDPFLQATFFGGRGEEQPYAISIHPTNGDVYIAGYSNSTNLPAGGAQPEFPQSAAPGSAHGFVARFNAALTVRVQTTYVGGDGGDIVRGMSIHPLNGDVYVTGSTSSSDLPGRFGGAESGIPSGVDAFIVRLDADLNAVNQSTYLGAGGDTQANAIAIHPVSGDIYIAGTTNVATLPSVAGGAQVISNAPYKNGFVARFNAALTSRIRSTYHSVTGAGTTTLSAMAIHPVSGDVYVAGDISGGELPGVAGGAQSVKRFPLTYEGYVTRFGSALTTRLQSTYVGESTKAFAIHPVTGEVYVAVDTSAVDFPGRAGGAQSVYSGDGDVGLMRLNAALTSLVQSTYLGGSLTERATALLVHPTNGDVYIMGNIDGYSIPKALVELPGVVAGALNVRTDPTAYPSEFIARFNSNLTTLKVSSYLSSYGGTGIVGMLAGHPLTGDIYSVSATSAIYFPGTAGGAQAANGYQASPPGSSMYDGIVARFTGDLAVPAPDPFSFLPQLNVPLNSLRTSSPVRITGFVGKAPVSIAGAPGSRYCVSAANNCGCDMWDGDSSSPYVVSANQYVCVSHHSSMTNAPTVTLLQVGTVVASFVVTPGPTIVGTTTCSLDIDGSGGAPNAATDGLMLVRAMLGFTGTAVTNGAISGTPPRNTWPLIRDYLNQNCGANFAP